MEQDRYLSMYQNRIRPFEPSAHRWNGSGHHAVAENRNTPTAVVPFFAARSIALERAAPAATRINLTKPLTETTIFELSLKAEIAARFDAQLQRIAEVRGKLSSLEHPSKHEHTLVHGNGACYPTFLLSGTLAYLETLAHPPMLPARLADIFERDFRRVEAMFHTVFYRKYHPDVLADAKQQAYLGLYKKWLKNRSILQQSAAYIVTAAIYSVSNWRQKSQDVRANEGTLLIDSHGKIMGHTAVHGAERWTDHLDFQFDLARATDVVLYQHEDEPDYRETYMVMQDILDDVRFQKGQHALGLTRGEYMKKRNALRNSLREQLIDYGQE